LGHYGPASATIPHEECVNCSGLQSLTLYDALTNPRIFSQHYPSTATDLGQPNDVCDIRREQIIVHFYVCPCSPQSTGDDGTPQRTIDEECLLRFMLDILLRQI